VPGAAGVAAGVPGAAGVAAGVPGHAGVPVPDQPCELGGPGRFGAPYGTAQPGPGPLTGLAALPGPAAPPWPGPPSDGALTDLVVVPWPVEPGAAQARSASP
jgi:hypothetical protein